MSVSYYLGTFNIRCNDYSPKNDMTDLAKSQVFATYLYFLLKVLDLLDTVSFIVSSLYIDRNPPISPSIFIRLIFPIKCLHTGAFLLVLTKFVSIFFFIQ